MRKYPTPGTNSNKLQNDMPNIKDNVWACRRVNQLCLTHEESLRGQWDTFPKHTVPPKKKGNNVILIGHGTWAGGMVWCREGGGGGLQSPCLC